MKTILSLYLNNTGIILYELLTVIPYDTWREKILAVRAGGILESDCVEETDQMLINELLAVEHENRTYMLEETIDAVNCIVDREEGNLIYCLA